MTLLDLTLPSVAENLALDEALLLKAEEGTGGEVLRLWENPGYAVVLGAGGSVVEAKKAACEADGVPILRRASGGGTVVLGPGCLCFAVVLAYTRAPGLNEIGPSARYVLEPVRQALREIVPGAAVEATSDLAVNGVKFSGNAQQRKRHFFLHHGTLLAGFDLNCITRYLNPPPRQPDYRHSRPHAEFVMNLPTVVAALKPLLVAAWQPGGEYAAVPLEKVRELVAEKYGRDEWNRRR